MAKKSLLNLSTKKKDVITIDGADYDILGTDDLSLAESCRLTDLAARAQLAEAAGDTSPETIESLTAAITEITDIILQEVPPEVRARLSDMQRVSVVEAFTPAPPGPKKSTKRKAKTSTGAAASKGQNSSTQSPPDSSVSTEAHREHG